jgi:hypothetical protein
MDVARTGPLCYKKGVDAFGLTSQAVKKSTPFFILFIDQALTMFSRPMHHAPSKQSKNDSISLALSSGEDKS